MAVGQLPAVDVFEIAEKSQERWKGEKSAKSSNRGNWWNAGKEGSAQDQES